MIFGELSRKYSPLEAWLDEHFIADRVLGTQSDIFEREKLAEVLAEEKERFVLDVGCGGGQRNLI